MNQSNGFHSTDSLPKDCLAKIEVSKEYVLHCDINNIFEAKIAVSTSMQEILIYDIESQAKVVCFKGHDELVTSIKFSRQDPSLLYSSALDGKLLCWDIRKGITPVKTYTDESGSHDKPLTCFDFNSSEQYICAGTEVIGEDSFLVFWDSRKTIPLGGYWNSHYDEITQVQFHSDSFLASSSLDGLINLFDLCETTEDDALQNTLKTESSVNRFCLSNSDTLSCITKDDEYQFWTVSKVKPDAILTKNQISEEFLCDVDYLIHTFSMKDVLYLVAGTDDGFIQLFSCNPKGLNIIKEFRNGHSNTIRTVCQSKSNKYLITGGEDGLICLWKSPL